LSLEAISWQDLIKNEINFGNHIHVIFSLVLRPSNPSYKLKKLDISQFFILFSVSNFISNSHFTHAKTEPDLFDRELNLGVLAHEVNAGVKPPALKPREEGFPDMSESWFVSLEGPVSGPAPELILSELLPRLGFVVLHHSLQ
jgi:hypothetical protein